jgi:hypothetical protein
MSVAKPFPGMWTPISSKNPNNRKMPFVCLVRGDNDMGHIMPVLKWENGKFPVNVDKVESEIKDVFHKNYSTFMECYSRGTPQHYAVLFRPKDPNNNILRGVIGDNVYVKITYSTDLETESNCVLC